MKKFLPLMVGAVLAVVMLAPVNTRADTINFFLNQAECSGGVCNSGNVPALLSSPPTEVIVTTTMGSPGAYTQATVEFLALTGTIDTPVYINVNGAITGASTVLGFNTGCSAGCTVGGITGPGSEDQFGTFSNGTGAIQGYSEVLFTLDSTTSWVSAASVLKLDTGFSSFYQSKNGDPGFMAVEGGAQIAGFYSTTPIPASGWLFGTGVLGLIGCCRKKISGSKSQAA